MSHSLIAQDEDRDYYSTKEGPGYLQGFADLGISALINPNESLALRLNLLCGAGFNEWLFLGIGPGLRISSSIRSIPLYADIRIGNRVRESAFYCALGIGTSIGSRKTFEVIGPAGHAEIGVRMNKWKMGGTTIYLGYEVYTAEVVEVKVAGFSNYGRFEIVDISAVVVGVGFSF